MGVSFFGGTRWTNQIWVQPDFVFRGGERARIARGRDNCGFYGLHLSLAMEVDSGESPPMLTQDLGSTGDLFMGNTSPPKVV